MKLADFPFLERFKGKHLIVTDGTTLLGGDDKAGVAEIMSLCGKAHFGCFNSAPAYQDSLYAG